jgi:hypothetical protein
MERKLLILMFFGAVSPIEADMCYDIKHDICFSIPESPEINPYEYDRLLLEDVAYIFGNDGIMLSLPGIASWKEQQARLAYIEEYLNDLGTPEALRLWADLRICFDTAMEYFLEHQNEIAADSGLSLREEEYAGIKYKVCRNLNKFKKP